MSAPRLSSSSTTSAWPLRTAQVRAESPSYRKKSKKWRWKHKTNVSADLILVRQEIRRHERSCKKTSPQNRFHNNDQVRVPTLFVSALSAPRFMNNSTTAVKPQRAAQVKAESPNYRDMFRKSEGKRLNERTYFGQRKTTSNGMGTKSIYQKKPTRSFATNISNVCLEYSTYKHRFVKNT